MIFLYVETSILSGAALFSIDLFLNALIAEFLSLTVAAGLNCASFLFLYVALVTCTLVLEEIGVKFLVDLVLSSDDFEFVATSSIL